MEEAKVLLDEVPHVGKVHREYYLLCSDFYRRQGDHGPFYQSCLRFLGCCQSLEEEAKEQDLSSLAMQVALAAILAEEVREEDTKAATKTMITSSREWYSLVLRHIIKMGEKMFVRCS